MRQSCRKGHAKVTAAALSQDSRLTRAKGSLTKNKDSARKTKRPDAAFSQTQFYTQPRPTHVKTTLESGGKYVRIELFALFCVISKTLEACATMGLLERPLGARSSRSCPPRRISNAQRHMRVHCPNARPPSLVRGWRGPGSRAMAAPAALVFLQLPQLH